MPREEIEQIIERLKKSARDCAYGTEAEGYYAAAHMLRDALDAFDAASPKPTGGGAFF